MPHMDSQTNKVYFSNILPKKHSKFSKEFFKILDNNNINYELISTTKDIWMRDYMPIQKRDGNFIRYIHQPDYLIGYSDLRTNPKEASIFLDPNIIIDIELNLDGGNIVRSNDKIICTDKIFKANADFSKEELVDILKSSLDIAEVIIIPEQPYDMTGHSDGLVRFIDENRVMISSYTKEDSEFAKQLTSSLMKQNLEVVTLPPKGYFREKNGAVWIPYINYMQVGDLIVLPCVGEKVEPEVIEFFQRCFPDCYVEYLDATSIIKQGGALNCISWNVYEK
ncbi:MAG: agmatine deiminase family protein [Sulfurimonas sp.]|nr:agmatine deiminase family protein [Sulfurimonas sp.]